MHQRWIEGEGERERKREAKETQRESLFGWFLNVLV